MSQRNHQQGLEDRKLVVRNTVVRPGKTNSRFTSLIHLTRFARMKLNKGQALWLGKAVGKNVPAVDGENVMLSDDTKACRSIMQLLAQQPDNTMIIKLLKEQAGFVGKPGHRAWRRIKKQLMENGMWLKMRRRGYIGMCCVLMRCVLMLYDVC